MQSSNEELESSKEELQSLNEELQTANHELNSKIEDLNRANSDLANLFDSTQIATVFLDRDLVIRSFTPTASQLFTIISTDVGRPLTDLAIKLHYPELQADIQAVLKTGTPMERRVQKDSVDSLYYLARLTPYRDSVQGIDGVVATFIDVSSLARAELLNQQLRADRLNLMGEMATDLAHELNQPLAAITAYLNALRRLLQMPPERRSNSVEDILTKATDQCLRAGRIISHLREFVSRGEPNKTIQSLHDLIREAYELILPTAKDRNISVTLRLDARKDRVLADAVQIKQVLINLMRNAKQAMNGAERRREMIVSTTSTRE